ncbi:LacI family DNA-binding transcriptional regulator [Paenibacillus abyssi]|uniref:LacI family transcriptional regulator n=1 Tax=Paenibacillus abyssi TaxID=1340531 RepID=A0A917G0E3_9BACL|nr:LacI family DNA-binding transcriptional regulator [Paenibacillus abyssi]GGG16721.1 LacI family transcriptional regulator [Paenibacillus abyssi]
MQRTKQPTMKDVAKLAGVTQPTVSNVVNGSESVSAEVRERVLKAIEELGYVPNALAKGLKQQRTNTVGLIIPDIESGFYGEIAKGVEKTLRASGYITFLCNTFYNPDLEKVYLNALIQQNVAGIIVAYPLVNKKIYANFNKFNIPLVVLDDKVEDESFTIPSVELNNISGSRLAVEHLYRTGAKRICFASEPLFSRALQLRYEGFRQAMEKFELEVDEQLILIENNQYDKIKMGYNLGAQILLNDAVDAIYASSDNLAFGIMKRLQEYGIKIPEDIIVIGYDDVPLSELISPTLTTVSQPKYQMAKKGSEILIKMMNKEENETTEVMYEPSLIIRQSSIKAVKVNS